jgi:S-formylglutathione hydrolase FrmB
MAFLLYQPQAVPLRRAAGPSGGEEAAAPLPVLYLLHGSGHDPHSVLDQVWPQEQLLLLGEALLVVPAGDQSWWLDSPLQPGSAYGTYVLELVRFVDEHYGTRPDRVARGICGFSMGGFGAMLAACLHPETFGAASSLLGPLDIEQMYPDYYRLRLLLGAERETWQRFNPAHLAGHLTHTAPTFCTASEAFDRPQNEAFAARLRSLGIGFEYHVDPGQHDSAFVREHIGASLAFHRRAFDQPV